MKTLAAIAFGYLVAQAVILLPLTLWVEWRYPSRATRRTLSSPFSIELD